VVGQSGRTVGQSARLS